MMSVLHSVISSALSCSADVISVVSPGISRPPAVRSTAVERGLAVTLLWLGLGAAGPVAAAEQPLEPEQLQSEVKAGPGDSWISMRGKICPIEVIQAANPAAANRSLRPGDVIRSPFVMSSELRRVNAQVKEL